MAAISPIQTPDEQPRRFFTALGIIKVAIVLILVLGSAYLL